MTHTPRLVFVVATARNRVIGREGSLPWRVSGDLKRFKAITMGRPVIMGRKTWDSLPQRPLPGRINIVVTRQAGFEAPGALVVAGVKEALARAAELASEEIAVIGGGEIFSELLARADRIYLSEIDLEPEGDTFFPALNAAEWWETSRETFERQEGEPAGFTLLTLDRVRPGGHN